MHWLDWSIVIVFFCGLMVIATIARRYTKSASDFLSANRSAGRYLITVSQAAVGTGVFFVIANFEKYYNSGMAIAWWGNMIGPIYMILAISGWVIYRYRETQAMTMAQFFEIRYSRRFRIFAGFLSWSSGLINYGIMPAIAARFFIYFCHLPVHTCHLGPLELNLTMGVVMIFTIGSSLFFTLMGGQIVVMITDFIQGQFMTVVVLIIFCFIAFIFPWPKVIEVLKQAPAGQSMLNPFKQGDIANFNLGFYAMLAYLSLYTYMAWPANQGYMGAAKSPHEAKMAQMLASWRYAVFYLLLMMMPICAYVMFHSDILPIPTQTARAVLDSIDNTTLQNQLRVSIVLTEIMPVGLIGLFAALMFAASISADEAVIHSLGSTFVQDILMPLGKKPATPEQHLKWLRLSVMGVAIFGYIFAMIFPLREYLFMFTAIIGAIYVGGAGAVLIGGLYWKRGTTAGAWTAMVVGSILAATSVFAINIFWPHILPNLKEHYPAWQFLQKLPVVFPLNGMQMSVCTSVVAVLSYIIVSLLTKVDPDFSMDKMLHRGKYAIHDKAHKNTAPLRGLRVLGWGPEYSRVDKFIYLLYFGWTVLMVGWFIVFSAINIIWGVSDDAWANWWLIYLIQGFVLGIFTTVWFLWGGFKDLFEMLRKLTIVKRDTLDDGTVCGHQNVDSGGLILTGDHGKQKTNEFMAEVKTVTSAIKPDEKQVIRKKPL